MGPRKRSKPNPEAEEERDLKPESGVRATSQPSVTTSSNLSAKPEEDADHRRDITPQASKTWYGGGTWRPGSKATPVTQVAKESILAATDKASGFLANAQNPTAQTAADSMTSPSIYLSRSLRRSNKPQSAASHTPKSDVTSESPNATHVESQQPAPSSFGPAQNETSILNQHDLREKPSPNPSPEPGPPNMSTPKNLQSQESTANIEGLPWRAWFSRNGSTAKPEPPKPPDAVSPSVPNEPESPVRRRNSDPSAGSSNTTQDTLPRSWLGLWAARSAKAGSADGATIAAPASIDKPLSSSVPATPNAEDVSVASNTQSSTTKAPGWAFWSREASGDAAVDTIQSNKGELVLAESPAQVATASRSLNANQNNSAKRPVAREPAQKASVPNLAPAQTPSDTLPKDTGKSSRDKIPKNEELGANKSSRNLLLPSLASTYRPAPKLSLLQSLTRWWQDDRSSGGSCVKVLHNPPRIKRALAIGVHGYFPVPLIRSVLGQPTGTSVRFADGAATAIQNWTRARGYECNIEKVALEGEGRITERVNMLWKLLLNWIDNIRQADFVMVACHSQGVPVAIMLIAKLIEFGCVQDARIGVCAMAGVNLGPFIDFKSRWIGGSAGELFDFARSDSQVSKDYTAALTTTLKSGVKIAYIGSIDDQVVSLEARLIISSHSLAVQNALETSVIGEANLARIREGAPALQNPYILPFSLRGVLEEDYVRNELHEETMELLRQFDEWKPSSKALKDVKFRLEGVRSKL
ncbi:MAG: hypothetical protein LQ343_007631 [Gyalolechia ehrenbergii]|nr:MAG: hypothetical protein LQ343_007631 [Gyalolechia ehrenbergii]